MISICPLWTFHLYVTTFQQHLWMEYIALWNELMRFSRACGSYHDLRDRGLPLTRKLLTKGSYWLSWSHHFESFTVVTMTTDYLCHKWPRKCSVCRNNPVFSSFMTCHRICNKIITTGARCGTGTAYPSGTHEYSPVFWRRM